MPFQKKNESDTFKNDGDFNNARESGSLISRLNRNVLTFAPHAPVLGEKVNGIHGSHQKQIFMQKV